MSRTSLVSQTIFLTLFRECLATRHIRNEQMFFNYSENLVKGNERNGSEWNKLQTHKRTRKMNQNDKTKTSHNYTVCYISGVSIFFVLLFVCLFSFSRRNLAALFEYEQSKKVSWENLFKFNGCLFYSFLLFFAAVSGRECWWKDKRERESSESAVCAYMPQERQTAALAIFSLTSLWFGSRAHKKIFFSISFSVNFSFRIYS